MSGHSLHPSVGGQLWRGSHLTLHNITHYIIHCTFLTQGPVMLKWLVTGREGGGVARAGQEADPGVFSVSRSATGARLS